jgi:hypothetical protein
MGRIAQWDVSFPRRPPTFDRSSYLPKCVSLELHRVLSGLPCRPEGLGATCRLGGYFLDWAGRVIPLARDGLLSRWLVPPSVGS